MVFLKDSCSLTLARKSGKFEYDCRQKRIFHKWLLFMLWKINLLYKLSTNVFNFIQVIPSLLNAVHKSGSNFIGNLTFRYFAILNLCNSALPLYLYLALNSEILATATKIFGGKPKKAFVSVGPSAISQKSKTNESGRFDFKTNDN